MLAGEGDPDEVVAARGLAVVSDDTALIAAVDEALAAQPDVAEKIRGGKVAAAGAIVGAVMKATRGQADAKRVRELVLERCRDHARCRRTALRTNLVRRVPVAEPGGARRGVRVRRGSRHRRPAAGSGSPGRRWAPACRRTLFTVPIQSSPSGARVAADSRPYTPLIRISGAPVKVPLPSGRSTNSDVAPACAITTRPGWAMQPADPRPVGPGPGGRRQRAGRRPGAARPAGRPGRSPS